MKNSIIILRSIFVASLLLLQTLTPLTSASAQTAPTPLAPPLVIREIKITGEEFVVLQATQPIDNLSEYWLGYSSSDTATNIVPSQQLPAQKLDEGQAILLTSDSAETCDAVLISKLSNSLGDTKGTLVVRRLVSDGASSTFTTVDSVNWAKPSASATTTDALDLRKEAAVTGVPVWYHNPRMYAGAWQVGGFANCSIVVPGIPQNDQPDPWPQTEFDPPAIIESLVDDPAASGEAIVPGSNDGLLPPQVTELMPNPAGTGNDSTDEFVELYNPNDAVFDLSGFVLQTGTATKYTYTCAQGTTLAAKSFRAFYSAQTGLSMSNTTSQTTLMDSFGTVLSVSDVYTNAKDGVSWALANGTWYWTNKPTPDAQNVIAQATAVVASTANKTDVKSLITKTAAVKGATTTKAKAATKTTKTTKSASAAPATTSAATVRPPAPIHAGVLAAVASLAVAYGVYEYRHDLANRIHQFRTNRTARRSARK